MTGLWRLADIQISNYLERRCEITSTSCWTCVSGKLEVMHRPKLTYVYHGMQGHPL